MHQTFIYWVSSGVKCKKYPWKTEVEKKNNAEKVKKDVCE